MNIAKVATAVAKLRPETLGDHLPGHVEIDVGSHGAAALVVWKMSDDDRSPECEEQARRLVACWNACIGVSTDWLEGRADAMRPETVPLDTAIESAVGERDVLWRQRDELLAALHDAATSLETISRTAGKASYIGDDGDRIPTFMENPDQVRGYAASRSTVARATIAKVKGGAA